LRNFSQVPIPTLGPAQPPVQREPGLFHGGKVARGVALTSHSQLAPRLKKGKSCTSVTSWPLLGPTLLYLTSTTLCPIFCSLCLSIKVGDQVQHTYETNYKIMVSHTFIFISFETRRSKVKIKQSRNRPGVSQRVPGGLGSQIFMTFGT